MMSDLVVCVTCIVTYVWCFRLRLSNKCITVESTGEEIGHDFTTEQDIFQYLNLAYVDPNNRNA